MAHLILISGQLAALKSTCARKLSKTLNIPCYIKDEIKEILGDTIGFQDRNENLKLSHATFEFMLHLAQTSLKINQDIILESNFKDEELKSLQQRLNLEHHQVITLWMTGDAKVLYQRYVDRDPSRHPVHRSTGLLSYEKFFNIMNERHENQLFGEIIHIDTTYFDESLYQNCVDQLILLIHSKK